MMLKARISLPVIDSHQEIIIFLVPTKSTSVKKNGGQPKLDKVTRSWRITLSLHNNLVTELLIQVRSSATVRMCWLTVYHVFVIVTYVYLYVCLSVSVVCMYECTYVSMYVCSVHF